MKIRWLTNLLGPVSCVAGFTALLLCFWTII